MKNLLILLSLIFVNACTPVDTDHCGNSACTEEFISISITITNQENEAYVLDSFRTIVKRTQETFTNEDSLSDDGTYSILNDSQKDKTSFEGEIFIFKGMKNGEIVVSEEFVIKKDCCHISYVSGNQNFTI
tara:strand:+ start:4307 stop:4699 length:393 start_codon:yes stop_codon:yes gene_type:complete